MNKITHLHIIKFLENHGWKNSETFKDHEKTYKVYSFGESFFSEDLNKPRVSVHWLCSTEDLYEKLLENTIRDLNEYYNFTRDELESAILAANEEPDMMILQGIFPENTKVKSIKQRLIDKEILFHDVYRKHYNKLTEEDIDYIIEEAPLLAAEYFSHHPLVKQNHVDYIVEKEPLAAIGSFSHKLSEENMVWLAENRLDLIYNRPNLLKKIPKSYIPKQKEKNNMIKTLREIKNNFSTDIEKFKQDLPFDYWRGFGSKSEFFDIVGNQIQLTKDGDYMTAKEWIPVLEFWLQQMKDMEND